MTFSPDSFPAIVQPTGEIIINLPDRMRAALQDEIRSDEPIDHEKAERLVRLILLSSIPDHDIGLEIDLAEDSFHDGNFYWSHQHILSNPIEMLESFLICKTLPLPVTKPNSDGYREMNISLILDNPKHRRRFDSLNLGNDFCFQGSLAEPDVSGISRQKTAIFPG